MECCSTIGCIFMKTSDKIRRQRVKGAHITTTYKQESALTVSTLNGKYKCYLDSFKCKLYLNGGTGASLALGFVERLIGLVECALGLRSI